VVPNVSEFVGIRLKALFCYLLLYVSMVTYFSMPRPPKTAWANKAADQSTLEAVYFGQRPSTGVSGPGFMFNYCPGFISTKFCVASRVRNR